MENQPHEFDFNDIDFAAVNAAAAVPQGTLQTDFQATSREQYRLPHVSDSETSSGSEASPAGSPKKTKAARLRREEKRKELAEQRQSEIEMRCRVRELEALLKERTARIEQLEAELAAERAKTEAERAKTEAERRRTDEEREKRMAAELKAAAFSAILEERSRGRSTGDGTA